MTQLTTDRNRTVKCYRVLVVEDDAVQCEIIRDCLGRAGAEIEMTVAKSGEEARDHIERSRFDFILLDHSLPDGLGTEVLEEMEHRLLTTPVIGLSTSSDPDVALADFRAGAVEFIAKRDAFKGTVLWERVSAALAMYKRRVAASVLERGAQGRSVVDIQDELVSAARTDPLMHIANRAAVTEYHEDLHRRAQEGETRYAVCLADIDNFKKYNDTYGHGAGDDALVKVADAIKNSLRPGDLVGRYGGEEIMVVLEGASDNDSRLVADRICAAVRSLEIEHPLNESFGILTISVGVGVFDPDSSETAAQLLERADKALYRVKEQGRNWWIIG